MPDNGNPPEDWNTLLKQAQDHSAAKRLEKEKSTPGGNGDH